MLPSSTELGALAGSSLVADAAARFGVPDWSAARSAPAPRGTDRHVALPLDHGEHGRSWILTTGEHDAGALVMRVVPPTGAVTDDTTTQFHLYRVDGAPVAHVNHHENGSTAIPVDAPWPPDVFRSATPAPGTPTIKKPGKAFFICFNACLQANGVQDAAGDCHACLTATTPVEQAFYCPKCSLVVSGYLRVCCLECMAT